jgi:hypothetical protein
MKLITHVDPSQLRLGYLSCLALVAGRQLDTRQGLVDRLTRFLFQTVDAKDPRWSIFLKRANPNEIVRLKPPEDEKTAALHELFRLAKSDAPAYPLHMLWLAQRQLPSHLGLLAPKNAEHILDMGRSFEIITAGYALSEKGVFLQNFLRHACPGIEDGNPETNPFDVRFRLAMSLFFFYTLLSVDVLTPFLVHEFACCTHGDLPNSPKLLQQAAMGLVARVERGADITNIDSLREARTYLERIQRKGVAKNQAQPRYHHLFELQLLDRVEGDIEGRRIVPYLANDACRRADRILSPLREQPDEYQNLLDRCFFGWAADIFARPASPCDGEIRRLLYFARGYEYLQREIGFTPGRTIALAGCLLAMEDGWIVEVAEMFDLLQRMAAGPWRPYLEYSGGSRLDQEFLIKVKPGLMSALEEQLRGAKPD